MNSVPNYYFIPRITSYNVCYTKLLRTCTRVEESEGSWYYTFEYEPLQADYVTVEKGSVVITSYSIHYTKLYDFGTCG